MLFHVFFKKILKLSQFYCFELGAIVTKDDLVNYKVLEKKPIETTLDDGLLRVISPPPPSSGVVLSFILNLLNGQ